MHWIIYYGQKSLQNIPFNLNYAVEIRNEGWNSTEIKDFREIGIVTTMVMEGKSYNALISQLLQAAIELSNA